MEHYFCIVSFINFVFQGVEKGGIENKWVKICFIKKYQFIKLTLQCQVIKKGHNYLNKPAALMPDRKKGHMYLKKLAAFRYRFV